MRQAAVGFHCPDCVAEAARTTRPARTFAGGLVPARVGVVSMVLIGINLAVWLLILATGGIGSQIYLQSGIIGGPLAPRFAIEGVADGAYWRLLTAAFVHSVPTGSQPTAILHIAFNMYALAIFGPLLEQMLGRLRFVALYVTGALVSSVAVYWFTDPRSFTIGASGAIFTLFGAAIVLLLRRGQDVSSLLMLLVINLVITFAYPGISWQGHLGGLSAGLLLGCVFAYAPRPHRTAVQAAAFGLTAAALVVATLARTAVLTS